jgi:O-antigen/teichoic acid export membrane protein
VITQAVFVLSALAIWSSAHLFPSDNNLGLVWARVLGQVATVAVLAWMVFGAFQRIRLPNMATFKRVWRRFHQFVIFNSPYSLIGTLGRDMMLYALAIFSTTLAVGLYGLARSLLLVPTSLLAASLRQVFYREAFEAKGTRRLEDLTVSLLHTTAITTAPLFGFVVVWGELLFSTVFGQAWAVAGLYAMVLAPATWMSVLTSWPDRLFEVSGRQNVSFGVQVTSDVACAFAAVIPLMLGAGSLVAIGCYAVVNVCQHALYLFAAFRVSRMSATRLALTLARGWGVFAAAVAVFALARLIPAQELILAGGCAILAAATAARHAFHGLRAVTVMMSASSEEEQ